MNACMYESINLPDRYQMARYHAMSLDRACCSPGTQRQVSREETACGTVLIHGQHRLGSEKLRFHNTFFDAILVCGQLLHRECQHATQRKAGVVADCSPCNDTELYSWLTHVDDSSYRSEKAVPLRAISKRSDCKLCRNCTKRR